MLLRNEVLLVVNNYRILDLSSFLKAQVRLVDERFFHDERVTAERPQSDVV